MTVILRRFLAFAGLTLVLAGAASACDSPTGPRFPEPVEKDDTTENPQEGIRWNGR